MQSEEAPVTTKPGRATQVGGTVEERLGFALAHRVRVEILTLLNESIYTADDLAELIGESRQNVHHHLRALLNRASIEIAKVEKKRNTELHYYRAIELPSYSEDQLAALTPEERQATAGLIVQCASAEIMASLAAGKMNNDLKVCLAWRWFNLDQQARDDLAEEQLRHWERVREIEIESINRCAKSGEDATSFVVAEWGFERARTAPTPPSALADKQADSF